MNLAAIQEVTLTTDKEESEVIVMSTISGTAQVLDVVLEDQNHY
jgi:hypothetical protein